MCKLGATVKALSIVLSVMVGLCASPVASATTVHAGDVHPRLQPNGQIYLDNPGSNGSKVITGDFRDFYKGPYTTQTPGFDHEASEFQPNHVLWFEVLDELRFWNGSQWVASTPGTESIRIVDTLGTATVVTASSISNASGIINAFDAAGNLHTHLDFALQPSGSAALGAYVLQLRLFTTLADLSTPINTASAPFYVALNGGLSASNFDTAVAALIPPPTPVPLPAGLPLALSASLGGLGTMLRRRSRR